MSFFSSIKDILTNPKHSLWIAPLLVAADAALCGLIIQKIPYTEIDWTTYMQQVGLYQSGERDYTAIKGDTGPLVYPAVHVYIYSFLHDLTDQGRDIAFAQLIFAGIYITTLIVVMSCYLRVRVPPYLLPLLVLSKRLHSIYVLRLFNDGIATMFMWISIRLFQQHQFTAAVTIWSLGVGVKMSLLLIAPAIAMIIALSGGIRLAIPLALNALLVQGLFALPFLQENPIGYLSRAFELTRQFLFEWTVNWRFAGEETFLMPAFSLNLLALHVVLLVLFAAQWVGPSRRELDSFVIDFLNDRLPKSVLSERFIMKTILTSLAIGMLCARSLHYQFFAYIAWATPFLLWQSGLNPIIIYAVCGIQEWAWNVFPSTNLSSLAVVLCLGAQVLVNLMNN